MKLKSLQACLSIKKIIVTALMVLLAACGQQGALYFPEQTPSTEQQTVQEAQSAQSNSDSGDDSHESSEAN